MKYWIGVVSESHVKRGLKGGFAQLCHGKKNPLAKMSVGDWLIYYSPKTDRENGVPLKKFTAIGRVAGEAAYEFQMTPDFVPFRRDIEYVKDASSLSIEPLLPKLSFIKNPKSWGFIFRTGHFEIPEADFKKIAKGMGVAVHE